MQLGFDTSAGDNGAYFVSPSITHIDCTHRHHSPRLPVARGVSSRPAGVNRHPLVLASTLSADVRGVAESLREQAPPR